MKSGNTGTSLGGKIVKSPNRIKREKLRREKEEKYWASMNGPVIVIKPEK